MGTPFLLYRQSDAFDQGAQFTDDDFPTVILFDISRSFFAYFASQPLIRKEFVKLAAEVPASFVVKCRAALQAMVLQYFAGSVYQYASSSSKERLSKRDGLTIRVACRIIALFSSSETNPVKMIFGSSGYLISGDRLPTKTSFDCCLYVRL